MRLEATEDQERRAVDDPDSLHDEPSSMVNSTGVRVHLRLKGSPNRRGGAEIVIDVNSSTLRLWSTNDEFITTAKELLASKKAHAAMFNAVVDGSDCDAQWSWHVDPATMSWPQLTIEGCDGRPSDIEKG